MRIVNPLDHKASVEAVKAAAGEKGVRCIILRSPCVALFKPDKLAKVNSTKCTGCTKCINELGCPALNLSGGKTFIEPSLCNGCTLCSQVCPFDAIEEVDR